MLMGAQACEVQGDTDHTLHDRGDIFVQVLSELHSLSSSDPLWIGGAVDGSGCAVLGEITEVAVSGRDVIVLDRRAHRVKIFVTDGICVGEMGGPGDGPGEFRTPVAMHLNGDTMLYVADSGHRRVEGFGLADGSWRHLSSRRLPFRPSGICAIDESVFVTGPHEGNMVHRMGTTGGSPTRSFGAWYHEVDDVVVRSFMESRPLRLGCDMSSDAVIAVSELTGEFEVYTPEGLVRYAGRLPGFVGFEVIRLESGGVSFGVPPESEGVPHSAASIVMAAAGIALVQYGARTSEGVANLVSVLVDLDQGGVEVVEGALPAVRAVGHDLIIVESASLLPRFAAYDRTERR